MDAITPRFWKFDAAGFAADVEKIIEEQRSRRQLAFDRQAFWERALDGIEDYDRADGDRPWSQRGK
jgi:hypothetical protein